MTSKWIVWPNGFAIACLNVSTTPLWQCLPFSWKTLRGKHCKHPIAVKRVVDTFRSCFKTCRTCLALPSSLFVWSSVQAHGAVLHLSLSLACNRTGMPTYVSDGGGAWIDETRLRHTYLARQDDDSIIWKWSSVGKLGCSCDTVPNYPQTLELISEG